MFHAQSSRTLGDSGLHVQCSLVHIRSDIKRIGVAIGVGYLVGTFPTADIVARKLSGGSINLRETGSGNPGGTNAIKVLGARAGAAVMAGDIGKGALACCAGALVAGPFHGLVVWTSDQRGREGVTRVLGDGRGVN